MHNLDLNNLIPDAGEITIGEQKLKVEAASLRTLFVVNKAMNTLRDKKLTPEQADEISEELRTELNLVVPGLDQHQLNGAQMMAIAEMIADRSLPKSIAKKDGKVTPDPKVGTE